MEDCTPIPPDTVHEAVVFYSLCGLGEAGTFCDLSESASLLEQLL